MTATQWRPLVIELGRRQRMERRGRHGSANGNDQAIYYRVIITLVISMDHLTGHFGLSRRSAPSYGLMCQGLRVLAHTHKHYDTFPLSLLAYTLIAINKGKSITN